VRDGDILVGKVTPKGETQLTPEEKLLRAIFGEKASDVKDTSLRCRRAWPAPSSTCRCSPATASRRTSGAKQIEEIGARAVRKDLADQLRIMETDTFQRLEKLMLIGKVADGGPDALKAGDQDHQDLPERARPRARFTTSWLEIRLRSEEALSSRPRGTQIKQQREEFRERFEVKKRKITQGDDLAPGVLKMVKVYVAVKRRIQPGDKMAGRHGNKGVISASCRSRTCLSAPTASRWTSC
jgi:DNA-directed RNA polymerase subunit beta